MLSRVNPEHPSQRRFIPGSWLPALDISNPAAPTQKGYLVPPPHSRPTTSSCTATRPRQRPAPAPRTGTTKSASQKSRSTCVRHRSPEASSWATTKGWRRTAPTSWRFSLSRTALTHRVSSSDGLAHSGYGGSEHTGRKRTLTARSCSLHRMSLPWAPGYPRCSWCLWGLPAPRSCAMSYAALRLSDAGRPTSIPRLCPKLCPQAANDSPPRPTWANGGSEGD